MTSTNQDILDSLESVARESPVDLLKQEGMMELAVISAAMSLKRIADSLEKPTITMNLSLPEGFHGQITDLAWQAGQSFKSGDGR